MKTSSSTSTTVDETPFFVWLGGGSPRRRWNPASRLSSCSRRRLAVFEPKLGVQRRQFLVPKDDEGKKEEERNESREKKAEEWS